jgi:hypothetical protein
MVINRVYAHFVAGRSVEQREHFDSLLAAPPGGWDEAERVALDRLYELADEEG